MASGFSVDRFKSQLKLSISRLIFLQKKLTSQSLAARKEIAELLKSNKTDQAITKVCTKSFYTIFTIFTHARFVIL
jgi:hypothetical protein